jgi:repressor LexA
MVMGSPFPLRNGLPERFDWWISSGADRALLTSIRFYVTIGYIMTPSQFRSARLALGLTQVELAQRLHTTRMSITRYEGGTRRIPGVIEVAMAQLGQAAQAPMLGVVAAGKPIEPVPQRELVDVPPSMLRGADTFVLRVKGESMLDAGILPGDLVVVKKQATAQNNQTVVALLNGEATIKKYRHKANHIELHPANDAMEPIIVHPDDEFRIEGIVIGVLRHCE